MASVLPIIPRLWRRDWAEELKSGKTYRVEGRNDHRFPSIRRLVETGRAPSDQRRETVTAFTFAAPKTGQGSGHGGRNAICDVRRR
jgi:hypothetical protein